MSSALQVPVPALRESLRRNQNNKDAETTSNIDHVQLNDDHGVADPKCPSPSSDSKLLPPSQDELELTNGHEDEEENDVHEGLSKKKEKDEEEAKEKEIVTTSCNSPRPQDHLSDDAQETNLLPSIVEHKTNIELEKEERNKKKNEDKLLADNSNNTPTSHLQKDDKAQIDGQEKEDVIEKEKEIEKEEEREELVTVNEKEDKNVFQEAETQLDKPEVVLPTAKNKDAKEEEKNDAEEEKKDAKEEEKKDGEKKFYPTDLNPFSDEEVEDESIVYPGDLNPFGDEDEMTETSSCAIPGDYDKSLNPFGDEDEDVIDVSRINPIPKPRRKNRPSSGTPATKAFRPAPPPPPVHPTCRPPKPPPHQTSGTSSPQEVKVTPRRPPLPTLPPPQRSSTPRKKPPAPKPPTVSTSANPSPNLSSRLSTESPLPPSKVTESPLPSKMVIPGTPESRRSLTVPERCNSRTSSIDSSSILSDSLASTQSNDDDVKLAAGDLGGGDLGGGDLGHGGDLSFEKKKKRPAPAPPKAVRREVIGSIESIQEELNRIGDRLAEIQTSVKQLEESFSNNPEYDSEKDDKNIYVYLELLKETCWLARKQEELMYQKREHKLEQDHADLEFEIRAIEIIPPFKRTPEDDVKVGQLLQSLIEVIDERNDVVENMTRINKRPDFDRGVDKLKKFKPPSAVDMILVKYLNENDIQMIETKVIPTNAIQSPEIKENKAEKKERKKKEKQEKKELKKAAKEKSKLKMNQESKISQSETNSVDGDSLNKFKKVKSPLKAIKKLSSTLSRTSSMKKTSSEVKGHVSSSSAASSRPNSSSAAHNHSIASFSPKQSLESISFADDSTTEESQKNSESHLI